MKNIKLFGIITLASMLVTACGAMNKGSSNNNNSNSEENNSSMVSSDSMDHNSGWSDKEKAIIKEHLYNANIPYIDGGKEELIYDTDYDYAYLNGGASSKAFLDEYAKKLEAVGWEDNQSTAGTEDVNDYGYFYNYLLEINTNDGVRYLTLTVGGTEIVDDSLEFTLDGSGALYLEIYDPYYYSWPEDLMDYYLLDVLATTETVPAYNGAYMYEAYASFMEYGFLGIFCYTNDSNAQSSYAATLLAAGYVFDGFDEDGYSIYVSPLATIEVSIYYDPDYEDLDIYVQEGDGVIRTPGGNGPVDENPLGGTDVLTIDSFGKKANESQYTEHRFTSKTTGATYDATISAATGLQLRSKSGDSGIVSSGSGGTIKSVSVSWHDAMASSKEVTQITQTLLIYASNTPFSITDMFAGTMTPVGSIQYRQNQTSYSFTTNYAYVGVRSDSGALYLNSITFVWNAPQA